ncbi:MAG TPA: hypothetical protein VGI10_15360 [Polyangiaceae bacterium]
MHSKKGLMLVGFPVGVSYACSQSAGSMNPIGKGDVWLKCGGDTWITIRADGKPSDKHKDAASFVCSGDCTDYSPKSYRRVRFIPSSDWHQP